MPVLNKDTGPDTKSEKYPVLLNLLAVISLAFLVWMAFYFRGSFESLEDKLSSYKLPETVQVTSNGAYGIEIIEGQTVYVPVYSHIYADGGKPHLLETTLSIRNLDPTHTISIKSVKYFDTKGTLVNQYLSEKMDLAPMATAEFLVEKENIEGGSGANFIVVWDAEEAVYEPIIEAVMVGFAGTKSISITSPGRGLIERKQ